MNGDRKRVCRQVQTSLGWLRGDEWLRDGRDFSQRRNSNTSIGGCSSGKFPGKPRPCWSLTVGQPLLIRPLNVLKTLNFVVPAKAGIQCRTSQSRWVPAFAGTTTSPYLVAGSISTSKIRHSSIGWNPVHRIFKHLDGLGPSLRWDDGVIRSSL